MVHLREALLCNHRQGLPRAHEHIWHFSLAPKQADTGLGQETAGSVIPHMPALCPGALVAALSLPPLSLSSKFRDVTFFLLYSISSYYDE